MSNIFFYMLVDLRISFTLIDGLVVEGIRTRQNHRVDEFKSG